MKIAFHTLGCKVNQYETEAMAQIFRDRGHEIVGEEEFADVYVVNTCTVTAMADRKSRQFIRRMKKVNPRSIIAVTGCYAQIDPDAVAEIEGVDIVTGINEKATLPGYIEDLLESRKGPQDAVRHLLDYDELLSYEDLGTVTDTEGRTRAYIKIEDGCDRFCSYCVIPYARGPVRSRPLGDIIEEAKRLIDEGYKEIVLTGINTALYGKDKNSSDAPAGESGLEEVIEALDRLKGDFRIRLSSLEPTVVDVDYVNRLLKYDRLCHHMHLSAQSGSNRVLEGMNRSYTAEQYKKIVDTLRAFDPCYGVSTDMIAGFPGENDEDVAESTAMIDSCRFCRTHVFRYSPRPRTSAGKREDQISPEKKAERADLIQAAGDKAAKSFYESSIGDVRRVLIEEIIIIEDESFLTGYTDNYIKVYIRGEEDMDNMVNTFVDVGLADTFRDGMLGELLLYEK